MHRVILLLVGLCLSNYALSALVSAFKPGWDIPGLATVEGDMFSLICISLGVGMLAIASFVHSLTSEVEN